MEPAHPAERGKMDNEITLEKIELVKDRTGVSYKEAKEALEAANGSVVDAIIAIEEKIDGTATRQGSGVDGIVGKIKEAVRKGNVTKITISRNDEVLLNLPVSIGIIGTVLFPWAGLTAAIAALGTKCQVNLTKDDGTVVDISDKVDSGFDTVMSKGGVIVDEVADKSEDLFNFAKEKGGEFVNFARDKFGKCNAAPAGAVNADYTVVRDEKKEDLCEEVKEEAGEIKEKLEDLKEEVKEEVEEIKENI